MKYSSTLVLSLFAASTLLTAPPEAGPAASGDSALIARARRVVGRMLIRLPNYTCLETLERTERAAGEKKFRMLDRVRVEVAFVNGEELYAWPGSPRIEETNLYKVISGQGAFGTGDFGQHLRVTYRGEMPLLLAGKVRLNGRDAWKLTQSVPASISHFDVIVHPARATVGYEVTAWHDAASLDLLRFELLATEFPKELPLRRTFKATEYATVLVNDLPIRLPAMTELSMTTRGGLEDRTVSTFSNCREYKGESKLIFEDPAPEETAQKADDTPRSPVAISLPPGVAVQVRLDSDVDLQKAARGDPITMTVTRDAFKNRRKVLSAGARVNGRWKLIACRELPIAYCFAILETESFEDGASSGRFLGSLESPTVERELTTGGRAYNGGRGMVIPDGILHAEQGAAILYVGMGTKLPRGYRLIWSTLGVSGGTRP